MTRTLEGQADFHSYRSRSGSMPAWPRRFDRLTVTWSNRTEEGGDVDVGVAPWVFAAAVVVREGAGLRGVLAGISRVRQTQAFGGARGGQVDRFRSGPSQPEPGAGFGSDAHRC